MAKTALLLENLQGKITDLTRSQTDLVKSQNDMENRLSHQQTLRKYYRLQDAQGHLECIGTVEIIS